MTYDKTPAAESYDEFIESIENAIYSLQDILIKGVHGTRLYSREHKMLMAESLATLLKMRETMKMDE